MSGRRRRGGGHGGEFHVDERWMASYMDMVTVLMCLFIVLYAMSTVNSKKFDELKNSLASGFGVTNSKKIDLAEGIAVPKELVDKKGAGFTASTYRTNSLQFAKELQNRIETAIVSSGAAKGAEVTLSSRGVTISLVGSSAYFGGNDASLKPQAIRVLKAVGPIVASTKGTITVEGHADPGGSAGPFGSDWALASARATSVLLWLVGDEPIAPARISAVSFGSAQPVKAGSPDADEHNRRVDIVLHTPQPATASTGTTSTGTAATGGSGTGAASSAGSGAAASSTPPVAPPTTMRVRRS